MEHYKMDILHYKYKNKIWRFLPRWLFMIFHKPIIYTDCYPTAIGSNIVQQDDSVLFEVEMTFTPPLEQTISVKFDNDSDNINKLFEQWKSLIKDND